MNYVRYVNKKKKREIRERKPVVLSDDSYNNYSRPFVFVGPRSIMKNARFFVLFYYFKRGLVFSNNRNLTQYHNIFLRNLL